MLCPRPIPQVPYKDAYGPKMQKPKELLWRCPCGTVVKIGHHRVVPSHSIPTSPHKARVEEILRLFDKLPYDWQVKVIKRLS